MEFKKITELIKNPQRVSGMDIASIDTILTQHPYFQSGQLLLAKGLLNDNSILYNRQLKLAAAHSHDRKKLFKLITIDEIEKRTSKILENIESKTLEEKLEIGKPLEFKESEIHTFSKWLTLINIDKIERKEESLVNNFLEKEVKISRPKKKDFFNSVNVAKSSLLENDDLVTPTLAKVYLEQGHYKKAIFSYKKLILKYPEKSVFFAGQIKLISKLNNK